MVTLEFLFVWCRTKLQILVLQTEGFWMNCSLVLTHGYLLLTFLLYIQRPIRKHRNFQQHSVHLDTMGDMTHISLKTQQVAHTISQQSTTARYRCESSPDGQTLILLPSNCKASWQTPDHATFRTSTEPSPPTKTCYHGTTHWRIWVVGASSFGSHTLSGFF